MTCLEEIEVILWGYHAQATILLKNEIFYLMKTFSVFLLDEISTATR